MIPLVIAYLSTQVPYIQSQTNKNSGEFINRRIFYLFILFFFFSVPKNKKKIFHFITHRKKSTNDYFRITFCSDLMCYKDF